MLNEKKYVLLNPPNPHGRNILKGYAGGFGVGGPVFGETLLPAFLVYGASALENSGCEYKILDAQGMGCDTSQAVDEIKKSRPDVLISFIALPSIYDDLKLLDEVKKAIPDMLIVAIGAVCNVMPEEILLKSSVDLIVKGGYPYYNLISNLVDVLKNNPSNRDMFDDIGGAIFVKEGQIVPSTVEPCDENIEKLSFDVYQQILIDNYRIKVRNVKGSTIECIPIVISVGCPHGCIYCPYPLGYGRKVINKSIECILGEIEFLKRNFGINGFLFRDQVFTHDRQRVLDLCDEIINRDLSINWYVEARVDEVSEELLSKMKQAGCFRVHYGVETGSPEMLKKTGKPGVEVETVKKAFRIAKEFGIATTAHMMLGLPGENQYTINCSFDLLCQINPDNAHLSSTTPYPGTKLFKTASERGLISSYDWSKYTGHGAIMSTGELSMDQVSKAVQKTGSRFRNYKLRHDSNYRRLYLKGLPKAIYRHLLLFPKVRLAKIHMKWGGVGRVLPLF